MTKRIPEIYKIYVQRLSRHRNVDGKISLKTARGVMTLSFRVPSEKVAAVFADMQHWGLITINGQRNVRIVWDGEEDWD